MPNQDIKHTQITLVNQKLKMIKFDKNPNVKLRRQYKDYITIEGTEVCFEKIWQELNPEEFLKKLEKMEKVDPAKTINSRTMESREKDSEVNSSDIGSIAPTTPRKISPTRRKTEAIPDVSEIASPMVT